jgi:hypothetical protein
LCKGGTVAEGWQNGCFHQAIMSEDQN